MAKLNSRGHEVLDPTPFAVNLPFVRHEEPLHLRIRRMVMETMRQQVAPEAETFEEANDFELDGVVWQDTEITDLPTPYEERVIASLQEQVSATSPVPAAPAPEAGAQPEPVSPAPAQVQTTPVQTP